MPLTRQQSDELGAAIEARRTALQTEIREDRARAERDRFQDVAGSTPDPGDESVASLIQDLDQADLGRDLEELRAVEAARDRLQNGTYGVCVDCGLDIDYQRLRANPSALRCIHCQSAHEKENGRPASPTL
jgi:RNA polymerase-binding transcription factor DksA